VWMSVDPLAEKYPNMSSYVYCANNPVKYVDPDGREIKTSVIYLPLISATLTSRESKFVSLNSRGFINRNLMNLGMIIMGGKTSSNYANLFEIVNNSNTVEFSAPLNKTAIDANGNPVAISDMAFQFKDPVNDEYSDNSPTLIGGVGIALAPRNFPLTENDLKVKEKLPSEQQYYSSNNNFQVMVNGRGIKYSGTFRELVLATAHELYGHVLMFLRGKSALHDYVEGRDANTELDNQLKRTQDETIRILDNN